MESQQNKLGFEATQVPSATEPTVLTDEQLDVVSGGDTGEYPASLPSQPSLQPGPQPGW